MSIAALLHCLRTGAAPPRNGLRGEAETEVAVEAAASGETKRSGGGAAPPCIAQPPSPLSAAAACTRLPSGHTEGYLEAFANIYAAFARALSDVLSGRKVREADYDYPTVNDGIRGMAFIEEHFGEGPWLLGEQFSAADVMTGFTLTAARNLGVLDERYPALMDYFSRIEARPAYQRAMQR